MATLSKQQLDAAQEFANATVSALKLPRGVHPPTLVAATARMAGTYLFRSFGLNLSEVNPGQTVLSEAANEQTPLLIQTAAEILAKVGIKLGQAGSGKATQAKDMPMMGFLETQRKLEVAYTPIKARFSLSEREAAFAAAVATALLIRHCAKALEPSVAFGVAAYGFIEGCKTAPASIEVA